MVCGLASHALKENATLSEIWRLHFAVYCACCVSTQLLLEVRFTDVSYIDTRQWWPVSSGHTSLRGFITQRGAANDRCVACGGSSGRVSGSAGRDSARISWTGRHIRPRWPAKALAACRLSSARCGRTGLRLYIRYTCSQRSQSIIIFLFLEQILTNLWFGIIGCLYLFLISHSASRKTVQFDIL